MLAHSSRASRGRSSSILAALALAACGGGPSLDDAGSARDAQAPDAQPFRWDGGLAPRGDADVRRPLDDSLSIFHVQLEATHNSYHLRPESDIVEWRYSHAPLDVQLEEQGVRGLELDLNWDPAIGAHRVFHVARVDDLSTCDLFVECLAIVRAWSDAHLAHAPIVIHVEVKDTRPSDDHALRIERIETEIRMVWPPELIVTPDRVRGAHPTLAEAVAEGWPTLGETRGQVLFALDDSEGLRDALTRGGTSLDGRLIFADSEPGDPLAAYAIVNDALATSRIRAALDAGMLVRVFGQDSVERALEGDRSHLDAALLSGAQIVSTDFPAPVPETSFFAEMPGGTPSRCNPITAPPGCTSDAIE